MPVVVTFPFRSVVPLPVSFSEVNVLVGALPTALLYVTVPNPAATVRLCAPSTVEPNVTLLFVVVSVAFAPSNTEPEYV